MYVLICEGDKFFPQNPETDQNPPKKNSKICQR